MLEKWQNAWIPPFLRKNPPLFFKDESEITDFAFLETGYKISTLNTDAQKLFEGFFESREFQSCLQVLKKFSSRYSLKKISVLRPNILGCLFEYPAFQIVKRKFASKAVVASPGDVLKIYSSRYQDRRIILRGWGLNKGMDGVSVPDGMIFVPTGDRSYVVAGCEYAVSLGGGKNFTSEKDKQVARYDSKIVYDDFFGVRGSFANAYIQARVNKCFNSLFPDMPPKLAPIHLFKFKTYYVFPKDIFVPLEFLANPNRRLLQTPFSQDDFAGIVDAVLYDFSQGHNHGRI